MNTLFPTSLSLALLSSALLVSACNSTPVQPSSQADYGKTTSNRTPVLTGSDYQAPADIMEDETAVSVTTTMTEPVNSISAPEPAPAETTRPDQLKFLFGFDQQQLDEQSINLIQQHAAFLQANPDFRVTINGHADGQGHPLYNEKLSLQRAQYVANLLIESGALEEQVDVLSWGASRPSTEEAAFAENRRVELVYDETLLISTNTP